MGNDTNYTSLIALVGTLALLIAAVYLVMNSTSFSQVRSDLRSNYVPTGMLDYGEKGKILKTLGFVYGIRNDFSRYKHSPPDSERSGLFRRKREVGGQVYVANPGSIYKLPSSLAVSNRQNSGSLQLVSVALDERALLDPEVGIVNSPLLRGMDGERPATVSFYAGGELHAAVNAGIKADGDRSVRKGMAGRLDQDYRILMRKKYGSESVSAEEIFGYGESQIKRLVLRKGSMFANELALDILERVGVAVPHHSPVIFFLNGQQIGLYTLLEHVSPRQWKTRLGHEDFLFYRHQGVSDEASIRQFDELRDWYRDNRRWIDEKMAGSQIDVADLTRNIIAIMFCGDDDFLQGAALLDAASPDPKWRWVVSDMEESFTQAQGGDAGERTWERDALRHVVHKDRTSGFWNASRRGLRAQLFARLLNNSPEYRSYFLRIVTDVLNHELTPAYLRDRHAQYGILLDAYEAPLSAEETAGFKQIGEFLSNRPDHFRREIQHGFDIDGMFELRVEAHDQQQYLVDGYSVSAPYTGRYFNNQTVELAVQHVNGSSPVVWNVGGEKITGNPIEFEVTSDIEVRLVSAEKL